MKKERLNTTIDLILLIFFTLASIYFLMEVYIMGYFPISLLIVCAIVLLLFVCGYFVIILNMQRFRILRRIFLVLVTVIVAVFSIHSSMIRHVSNKIEPLYSTAYHLSLTTGNEKYNQIEDLNHQTLGYMFHDKKHLSVIKTALEEAKIEVELVEYMTHSDLSRAMNEQKIAGFFATDANLNILKNEQQNLKEIAFFEHQIPCEIPTGNKNILSDSFVVLVSGCDASDLNGACQSDLNMLLMVNPRAYLIELVSLPENLYVPYAEFSDYPDILMNTSNEGIRNTMTALSNTFGFDIDYYVRINFNSFIQFIDQMEGVDIEVNQSFCEQDELGKENSVCLEKGKQTLNGQQALAFVRHQDEQSRLPRQQQLVAAVAKKVLNRQSLPLLTTLASNLDSLVSTNIDLLRVPAFVQMIGAHANDWTFNMSLLTNGFVGEVPCVSLDPKQRVDAYILSERDLALVYDLYQTVINTGRLDQFTFSLNEFHGQQVLPPSHEKLVTVSNYKKKILKYFALEPYSTVYPIEIEEMEKESSIQNPIFDPFAPIIPLN